MMTIAKSINQLVPMAQYRGMVDDNTKEQFDSIEWCDARPKPSWENIQATMGINTREYDPDKLILAIDALELSDSLDAILKEAPARIRLRWQKAVIFKGEDPDFQAMIATLKAAWGLTDEQTESLLSSCVIESV